MLFRSKNAVLINALLTRVEEMLFNENPDVFINSIITPEANLPDSDIYGIVQKLNMYYCVYYSALERWDELEERLDMLLEDTKRNMKGLLNRRDKLNPIASDEWIKYYYLSDFAYEPLYWLYYHDLPNYQSLECLAETYEKYAVFLAGLSDELSEDVIEICKDIQMNAEEKIQRLCDRIILNALDGIECKFGPEEYWDNKITHFEEIKAKSDERTIFL